MSTVVVSTDASGNPGNSESYTYSPGGDQLSADGRYLVFHSTSTNLVAGDTNGVRDLFLKDLLTGEITRISTVSNGIQANGIEVPSY